MSGRGSTSRRVTREIAGVRALEILRAINLTLSAASSGRSEECEKCFQQFVMRVEAAERGLERASSGVRKAFVDDLDSTYRLLRDHPSYPSYVAKSTPVALAARQIAPVLRRLFKALRPPTSESQQ